MRKKVKIEIFVGTKGYFYDLIFVGTLRLFLKINVMFFTLGSGIFDNNCNIMVFKS